MTWEEQRWIGQQFRRLCKLGAPREVMARWNRWLDASESLPSGTTARDRLAEHLDDLGASMPEPFGVVLN